MARGVLRPWLPGISHSLGKIRMHAFVVISFCRVYLTMAGIGLPLHATLKSTSAGVIAFVRKMRGCGHT